MPSVVEFVQQGLAESMDARAYDCLLMFIWKMSGEKFGILKSSFNLTTFIIILLLMVLLTSTKIFQHGIHLCLHACIFEHLILISRHIFTSFIFLQVSNLQFPWHVSESYRIRSSQDDLHTMYKPFKISLPKSPSMSLNDSLDDISCLLYTSDAADE